MSDDSDETLRDRVLRESLKVGYPFDVARLIADACVREGDDANARVAAVAASYDAKHMVQELLDRRVAVNEVKQMFQHAAHGARHLDIYGMQRVRGMLQQRAFR